MPEKVKQGLGLLAVAALALLVLAVTAPSEAMPIQLVGAVAGLTMAASAVVGLALIAWGLLRD